MESVTILRSPGFDLSEGRVRSDVGRVHCNISFALA